MFFGDGAFPPSIQSRQCEISPLVIGAAGVHLVTFRTQKLSLPAPMVLGGKPPGRVGHRQGTFLLQRAPARAFFACFSSSCSFCGSVQEARGCCLSNRSDARLLTFLEAPARVWLCVSCELCYNSHRRRQFSQERALALILLFLNFRERRSALSARRDFAFNSQRKGGELRADRGITSQ